MSSHTRKKLALQGNETCPLGQARMRLSESNHPQATHPTTMQLLPLPTGE